MEVSPKTLREVEFREKMRGYHPEDVDHFLEQVAAGIEVLQDRLRQAVERAQRAEAAAAEAGGTDETLRKTLILAQRTADLAVQEAREQAARILAGAEQQAQADPGRRRGAGSPDPRGGRWPRPRPSWPASRRPGRRLSKTSTLSSAGSTSTSATCRPRCPKRWPRSSGPGSCGPRPRPDRSTFPVGRPRPNDPRHPRRPRRPRDPSTIPDRRPPCGARATRSAPRWPPGPASPPPLQGGGGDSQPQPPAEANPGDDQRAGHGRLLR